MTKLSYLHSFLQLRRDAEVLEVRGGSAAAFLRPGGHAGRAAAAGHGALRTNATFGPPCTVKKQ